jgi:hypothetical protein
VGHSFDIDVLIATQRSSRQSSSSPSRDFDSSQPSSQNNAISARFEHPYVYSHSNPFVWIDLEGRQAKRLIRVVWEQLDPLTRAGTKVLTQAVFSKVQAINRFGAREVQVPKLWHRLIQEFARQNPKHGNMIIEGLKHNPKLFAGVGSGSYRSTESTTFAHAFDRIASGAVLASFGNLITLGNQIFFKGSISISDYVHELVHVAQYSKLGTCRFLGRYTADFVRSIVSTAKERGKLNWWKAGSWSEDSKSSGAYTIEKAFSKWLYGAEGTKYLESQLPSQSSEQRSKQLVIQP